MQLRIALLKGDRRATPLNTPLMKWVKGTSIQLWSHLPKNGNITTNPLQGSFRTIIQCLRFTTYFGNTSKPARQVRYCWEKYNQLPASADREVGIDECQRPMDELSKRAAGKLRHYLTQLEQAQNLPS